MGFVFGFALGFSGLKVGVWFCCCVLGLEVGKNGVVCRNLWIFAEGEE